MGRLAACSLCTYWYTEWCSSIKRASQVLQLLRNGPLSAGELSDQFSVSKPTMSAHFAVLKEADLVHAEKEGKSVIYHLKLSVLEEALLGFIHSFGASEQAPARKKGITR